MPADFWYNLLWIAVVSIGLGLATGVLRKRRSMQVFPSDLSGWQEILPDHTRRERLCASIIIFFTSGVPLLAFSAYACSKYPGTGGAHGFTFTAILIALAEAGWVTASLLAYNKCPDDASVAVEQVPFRRGDDLALNIEVPVRGPLPTEILAQVVCIEHAVLHMGRYTQMSHRILKEESLRIAVAGQRVRGAVGTGRIRIPADNWPASGQGKSLNYRYEWQLRVELPSAKGHYSVFPIEVL